MLEFINKIPANVLYSIILVLFSCITTLFGFLAKQIKNTKVAKFFSKLQDKIKEFCADVEKMSHYTAEEKENYVVVKAKEYLIQNNFLNIISDEELRKLIQSLIAFTKQVNYKKVGE